ncbi:MAG: ABC transporter permease, partial [Betaproteobacteria bacterium]|nr:ABC transporter permease [Betaproteobacteria bacterium]
PITLIVEAIRDIVMKQMPPDFSALSLYLLIALALAGSGYAVFQTLKKGFVDVL